MGTPTKRTLVKLGDGTKKRYFRFTWAAIRRLKEETGQPLELTLTLLARMDADAINAAVWAGLLYDEPEITMEEVEGLINLNSIEELIKRILTDLTIAMGKPDPFKKKGGGKPEGEAEGKGKAADGEESPSP